MKNIVLICAGGMSTGLIVNQMKKEAERLGKEYSISAHGLSSLERYAPTADIILFGPQVRFAVEKAKAAYPNIPVEMIDMTTYGRMDGKKILETAMKEMGE